MTPLIERTLTWLTGDVNLSMGLANPNDRAKAEELLIRLHDAGETIQATEIEDWALSNDWDHDGARDLSRLTASVARGGLTIRSQMFVYDIIDQFRDELNQPKV